jgi:hypothetical protein
MYSSDKSISALVCIPEVLNSNTDSVAGCPETVHVFLILSTVS